MKTAEKKAADMPVRSFRTSKEWLDWLARNHARSNGIWVKIAKKGSATKSLSYGEAVEAALCYGWIDGQKRGYDKTAWLQKFTPRGAKSIWSKINREKAQALIANEQMTSAGLQAIERAKQNGQWDAAYDSQRGIEMPEDFQRDLDRRPQARKFFEELNSVNRYAILHRIQTAKKPETRARRIQKFVDMLEKQEKIYP
jgi:uncharacterized protein YdeI (YjbR/CyaY-like superfamily)